MEEARQVFKWFAFNDFHKEFLKRMQERGRKHPIANIQLGAANLEPLALGLYGYPEATPRLPRSHLVANRYPPGSYPEATLRLPRGST